MEAQPPMCFSEADIQLRVLSGSVIVTNASQVYDVTEFVDKHPGGEDYLLGHNGTDVTQVMKDSPHGHSPAAYSILNKYHIGQLRRSLNDNVLKQRNKMSNTDMLDKSDLDPSVLKAVEYASELEKLVDWDKPILEQVGGLHEKYYDWVHYPEDKHIRLFHSDFCEYFSQCPWYWIPILWIPTMLVLLTQSFIHFQESSCVWPMDKFGVTVSTIHMPILFVIGILLWTLVEYILHRWLFHLRPPSSVSMLITLHFVLHGQHHKTPLDKARLVFPPVPGFVLAYLIYCLFFPIFPYAVNMCLFAGGISGYIMYDLTHYYIHHGRPYLKYFQNLKNYHVKHHFEQQNLGFGISSKLWDYPFGTLIKG